MNCLFDFRFSKRNQYKTNTSVHSVHFNYGYDSNETEQNTKNGGPSTLQRPHYAHVDRSSKNSSPPSRPESAEYMSAEETENTTENMTFAY